MGRAEVVAVRVLIGTVIACLAVGEVLLRLLVPSGTLYELYIYMAVVAVASWLPWHRPTPKYLALWATVGWAASIAFMKLVDPAIDHVPTAVKLPAMVAMPLVLVGAPVVATLMSDPDMRDGEPLGRKLHELVKGVIFTAPITLGLAIGQLPTVRHYSGVVLGVAIELIPAILLWLKPTRVRAALWWLFAFPAAGMHAIAVFGDIGLGRLLVTLLFYCGIVGIGVPIAIFTTFRQRSEPRIPEARVIDD